jgi:hypothetical protein
MYCMHGVHAMLWHKAMALPMLWRLHGFGRESFCLSSLAPLRDGGMGASPCASDDDATGWVWVWDAPQASIGFEDFTVPWWVMALLMMCPWG